MQKEEAPRRQNKRPRVESDPTQRDGCDGCETKARKRKRQRIAVVVDLVVVHDEDEDADEAEVVVAASIPAHNDSNDAQADAHATKARLTRMQLSNASTAVSTTAALDRKDAIGPQTALTNSTNSTNSMTSSTAPTTRTVRDSISNVARHSVDHKSVMAQMREVARVLDSKSRARLYSEARRLGFDAATVDRTLTYIKEHAPIMIHFRPCKVSFFAKDTHFRNAFELYPELYSGPVGTPRRAAESAVFGGRYDSAAATDRVKYGVLNLSADPSGSKHATKTYGEAYLLLKPHVRSRVTVTPRDSFGVETQDLVGTPEHYAHLLNCTNDDELRQALTIGGSVKFDAVAEESVDDSYREIQIHGDVRFDRDVDAVVIPGKFQKELAADAAKFATQNNIQLIWL